MKVGSEAVESVDDLNCRNTSRKETKIGRIAELDVELVCLIEYVLVYP